MANPITVVKDIDNPVLPEVFEASIVEIANGMKKLNASRLTREALVILLHHYTRVSQTNIRHVLNGLDNLERHYLVPKKKEGSST